MNPDPIRLFVALYPPGETAREMIRAVGRLFLANSRPTPVDQLHMTLQFIGDTDPRDLGRVNESVSRSVAGLEPFNLTPLRLMTLPERRTPRLIALETDAPPALLEIHRRLVTRLAKRGRERGGDHYLPHLTLARFTGGTGPPRMDQPVDMPAFRVESIVLVQSRLKPHGAEHHELARFHIGPA